MKVRIPYPDHLLLINWKFSVPRIHVNVSRHRPTTDQNFEDTEVEELIAMLRETENLEEQGDILQYLVDTQGLDFNTGKSALEILFSLHVRQTLIIP